MAITPITTADSGGSNNGTSWQTSSPHSPSMSSSSTSSDASNNSSKFSQELVLTWDDATWILTSSFIIFTMQSGFGLLESGCVGNKNEVNIMMKNVGDVIFGGISYWMLGYGFSFGTDPGTNAFCGVGRFFLDPGVSTLVATLFFSVSSHTRGSQVGQSPAGLLCNFEGGVMTLVDAVGVEVL